MASRDGWEGQREVAHPGAVAPGALWFFRRVLYPAVRVLHRPTLDGIANLPPAGEPFLLVSNHPSGLGGNEFLSFIALYACAFPDPPRLAAFVLAVSFTWWPLSYFFSLVGAIPSTYAAAEHALGMGVPIVVFPGGDHEALRPFWKMDHADLAGRKGFLRIAKNAWVPIVPMGIRGVSAPILFRSRLLGFLCVWPRLVGLKRFGLSILAIIGVAVIFRFVPLAWYWRVALVWFWIASPLSLVGWLPTRTRIRIGKPLSPESLFGSRSSADEARLDAAVPTVEAAITDLLAN